MGARTDLDPLDLAKRLTRAIDEAVLAGGGSTRAIKPGHRVKFKWPPAAVSREYNIHSSDWAESAEFEAHQELFPVVVARNAHGVFGKCESLWLEAMGTDVPHMLKRMRDSAEPLFKRQFAISNALGQSGRFKGSIRDLGPLDILKLLYCEDRDVANSARIEVETNAKGHLYTPSLIVILKDRRHPNRRIAQWCVLDLFEDLPTYVSHPEEEQDAVRAMKSLLWDAEDDYARTVFKAGTVLGGHIQTQEATDALLDCLLAPSRIGRRSAIHALFHVVEWQPNLKDRVVDALRHHVEVETDRHLKEFARAMAQDLTEGAFDHIPEPIFPDEP